jgi:hypothetical protein
MDIDRKVLKQITENSEWDIHMLKELPIDQLDMTLCKDELESLNQRLQAAERFYSMRDIYPPYVKSIRQVVNTFMARNDSLV